MNRFIDQTAIVTGAGSGLGYATAVRLAAEGAAVACLDIGLASAQQTAAVIGDRGGRARAYHVEISEPTSVRAAVAAAVTDLGRPSVLVNCAGIGKFANTLEVDFDEWSRILGVNLTGTFLMAQAVLPYLLDGGGNIVNIASTAGLMGHPYAAAYCASKGGVVQLTRALADEFLHRQVRVNAIAPGAINTPLLLSFNLPPGADPALMQKLVSPLGGAAPEDVAALIAFVASEEGRYMTGSIVSIDGGISI